MLSTLRQCARRVSSFSSSPSISLSRRWMSDIATPAGILTNLFSASTMPRVPLHQEFPGLPAHTANSIVQQSEEASVSTLANGVRVVTLPSSNVAIGSVGVFVEAGSRYEDSRTTGLTHFMELMAFKSTKNRSDFRLVRDMLKIGANITAAASREHLVLTGDALKQYLPHVLGALADVIQNSAFHPHEIVAVKEKYELDYVNRLSTPDIKMMEAIQEAAYFNNTLGNPLYASVDQLNNFNSDVLQNFANQFFTAPRIVVAAVGVEHEDMKQLTQHLFGGLNSENKLVKAKAQYTGGECRMHFRGLPTAHLAIAFETASWGDNDVVPMCVLQMLMGGGGSFSAGGPGKGMYSRLYTNVLNKHDFVESATSFNSIYSDSSLFGLYGVAEHRSASKLADVLIREALRMAGPVDAVELLRAKNALKSAMLIQLEHRNVRLEDIGKQLSTLGKITSVSEVCKKIDAVTAEDVQRVAKKMLATNPAVAAYGDLAFVPRYDTIQKAFK